MPTYREPRSGWLTTALLLAGALLVIVAFYLTLESRPEMKDESSLTSATVPGLDCPTAAQLAFEGATDAQVVADAPTLDRLAMCLRDDRSRRIQLGGVSTVSAAQRVAAALEGRGVSADELHRVTFANGLPLCEPADWSCWRERDTQLARQ
jgi:hypothetical protein